MNLDSLEQNIQSGSDALGLSGGFLLWLLFAAIVIAVLVGWRLLLRSRGGPAAPASLATDDSALGEEMRHSMRRQQWIALLLIAVFFGGFVGWSSTFKLASGVVAPGVVTPEGRTRPVQHLEGGIVSKVLVRDGDHVSVNQPLVVLEGIRARSEVQILADQRDVLRVQLARLNAEQAGEDSFVTEIPAAAGAGVREAAEHESEMFRTRRQSMETRNSVLETRRGQLLEEIKGVEDQIVSINDQLSLLNEETADAQTLFDQQLERRSRLLALKRNATQLTGQRAQAEASIARAGQAISEVATQMENLRADFREEVSKEIAAVQSNLLRIEAQLTADEDVLGRTTIVAPEAGTVKGLRVTSAHVVVAPGAVLLEIVPDNAELLMDVQLSPMDIDNVTQGQTAQVHLLSYSERNMPQVEGTVERISADRYVDENTGAPYFLALVSVDMEQIHAVAPNVQILPGMPVQVVIRTGEQTLADYLIGPLMRSLGRSFREA